MTFLAPRKLLLLGVLPSLLMSAAIAQDAAARPALDEANARVMTISTRSGGAARQ